MGSTAGAAFVWIGLIACGGPPAAPEPTAAPVIRVGGSETLTEHLLPDLAKRFAELHPEIEVAVTSGGSGKGIRGLLDQELDLGASSREANPSEDEQAKATGWSFGSPDSRHVIGVDVVAVAVHPSNPIASLTYDDVIRVFCDNSVKSWAELGGPDIPVHAMTRDPASGTRALFEDFFCGPRGIHAGVQQGSIGDFGRLLTEDPGAVAYVTLSENAGRTVPLRPEADAEPISPTLDAITVGAYPLFRDVLLYSRGAPKGEVATFLAFIQGEAGQKIIADHRFVPLQDRPTKLDGPRPLRQTVQFEAGAIAPTERSRAQLAFLVEEIKAHQHKHVVLEGYADASEVNGVDLSRQRAEAVQVLLAPGLPDVYFEVIPRGADNPIAPNDTPYGRLRNRRVQIYLAAEEASSP